MWCAAHPRLAGMGGVYCQDVDIAERRAPGATGNAGVAAYAVDPEPAERLWTLSETLTGAAFAL